MTLLRSAPCRHGVMVWPPGDTTIGRALELYGEFAEGENRVMARYLATGNVMFDVGANLGTTVLPAAKAVGKKGMVMAFEPQALMVQCLCTTLSLNDIFHVRVIGAALGCEQGWGSMAAADMEEGGNHGARSLGTQGMRVPIFRLDDLELPACHLVKIDVEGYEWPVIQGGQRHLLQHRPVVYLEAKRTKGTENCLNWLLKNGWRCYWHFAFFFQNDNYRGSQGNVFGTVGDMNILAVPPVHEQPDDMPEIASATEDWRMVYEAFYRKTGKTIP
jgi:FkbM family methyltransferase